MKKLYRRGAIVLGIFLICGVVMYRASLAPNALSIRVLSPQQSGTYQLFYDVGRGFNEVDSLRAAIHSSDKAATITFFEVLFAQLRTFRIDPVGFPGDVQIESIRVQHEFSRLGLRIPLYRWTGEGLLKDFRPRKDIAAFALTDQGLTMTTTGNDPQFEFHGEWRTIQSTIAQNALQHKIILAILLFLFFCVIALFYWKREQLYNHFQKVMKLLWKEPKFNRCIQMSAHILSWLRYFFREKSRAADLFFLILIVCLTINTLGANPFKGETVAPTDILMMSRHSVGFKSLRQGLPSEQGQILNGARSDVIDHNIPHWKNVKTQLRAGEDVRWNKTRAGGMIGIQYLGGAYFTPAWWLFYAFQDDALGFYMAMLINLLIAGVGTFILLRIVVSAIPALFSAVVFMFSGPIVGWFFWPHVSTAIWLPWLLWTTIRYLEHKNPRWLLGITITSTFLILGGFPAVAAFGFYAFLLLVGLWNLLSFPSVKNLFIHTVFPMLAVGLAFLISGVVLLPFWEFSNVLNILGPRSGRTYFKGWSELPFLFDNMASPRAVYPQGVCYVGMLAIFFCIVGIMAIGIKKATRTTRIVSLYATVLTILSLSLAFGLFPHDWIRKIPVFDKNYWNRLTFVSVLTIAILAGIGFELFLRFIHSLIAKRGTLSYGHRFGEKKRKYFKVFASIGIFFLLCFQYHDQKSLHRRLNAITPAEWFYPETASIQYITQHLGPLQYILSDNAYFIAGTLGAYELSDWYAHGFHSQAEKKILKLLVKDPFKTLTAAYFTAKQIQFEIPEFTKLVDVLGIKFILVNAQTDVTSRLQEQIAYWNVIHLEKSVKILERKNPIKGGYHINNLQRLPSEEEWKGMGTGLNVVSESTTDIIVQNTEYHDGWIVLPMRNYPGWNAYIDDQKVSIERYLEVFPAIKIQGPCEIRYKYEPNSLKYGVLISGMGIFVWCAFAFITFKKKERV